ncbi:MAG: hypothetical protein RBS07_04330 [Lentimicrobium sp.]|nr:hypothetical protein [Lentimicrobium sp.]
MRKLIQMVALSLSLVLSGCSGFQNKNGETQKNNSTQLDPGNTDQARTGLQIKRYEIALFESDQSNLKQSLEKLVPEYSIFLGKGNFSDEEVTQLRSFIADGSNKAAYHEVSKQFQEIEELSINLGKAYEKFARETGKINYPETFTYLSGFDVQYPIKYADTVLIIALDMYLGSNFDMYKKLGIPAYISSRYTAAHILPDCVKEMAYPLIPEKTGAYTLLDAMIEQGKLLYFTQIILPDTPEELIIGFNEEQLKWCQQNESNLWKFIIENELLYSTDSKAMSMFMVDGPFTSSFSQESPARTGAWLGWQIVKSYMDKNNIALTRLTAIEHSREILDKSGYKPKKN